VLFDGKTHIFMAPVHNRHFLRRRLFATCRSDATMRLCSACCERALQLTVRPYRRDRLLVEKVRQTLAEHPEHSRNADDLAAWLNLSARTLHRQLKEEGASLQQLKDAVRRDLATDLAAAHATPHQTDRRRSGVSEREELHAGVQGLDGANAGRIQAWPRPLRSPNPSRIKPNATRACP
jgi:AraC-like DNA-binding protein